MCDEVKCDKCGLLANDVLNYGQEWVWLNLDGVETSEMSSPYCPICAEIIMKNPMSIP